MTTAPSLTETVFALGAGSRVVGVSAHCNYPPDVLRLPRIGTYTRPDPERIAALRPDLVLLHGYRGDLRNRLEALGLRTLVVEQDSLEDVFHSLLQVGQALERRQQAEEMVIRIREGVEALRHRPPPRRPRTLIVVGRQPDALRGVIVVGPKSWLGALAEVAGAVNVVGPDLPRSPRVSLETILAWDPELILDASATTAEERERDALAARLLQPWLQRRELTAVRAGRVVALTEDWMLRPGPRVLAVLERLAAMIRGTHR
ncbi:MAG: helical backbone metal receptor [Bryobacterales bacterium]|nr:helical backbone metal receptor [Bryobacteraceae bacterium]MDW8355202.1 helical backbone metal receptor [Bryobacterales bacterium]